MKSYWIYIICSKRNGTLYVGITKDIVRRIYEHKNGLLNGFSKKYNINILVHVEEFNDIRDAIARERQLKQWNRAWKLELIEKHNPEWEDLYNKWFPFFHNNLITS